jgi:SAM-dependent methyltransferase
VAADDVFHLGLMAELNAASNADDAPEVAFYLDVISQAGGPVLDAGCGPGRLLRRGLVAGVDMEGSDISADMLAIARRRCRELGLEPTLHQQSTATLALDRRFSMIVMCGALGLNGRRSDDVAALERVHAHLVPGGEVVFDVEPGWANPHIWSLFADPSGLPAAWEERGSTPVGDGAAIETDVRDIAVDPDEMAFTRDVRCRLVRDGRTVRTEVHRLVMRSYNPHELLGMLRETGYAEASFEERPLWSDGPFHVFRARRPGG